MLKQLISDAFYGVKDSLSGWYVCYKCWHDEAHMLRDTPPPPKQFSYLAKRRSEQQKKKDKDGTLVDIIKTTVITAGVALLITFLIDAGCSYIASFFGENLKKSLAASEYIFGILWWLPSMIVIKLTSIINNNEVADKVFLHKYGKPKYSSIGATISEFIFSSIYQLIFVIQATIVCILVPWPWVAVLLDWLHYSLFYALYAFEYKWALLGIPGHTRVAQIENNWPYYFAFGLPIHLAIGCWESLHTRTMIFTLMFPFSILGATAANPPRNQFVFPIHIMFPSVYITNEVYKWFRGPKTEQEASHSR
ncbi:etoposide-induced protein 2.4 homolog [Physella acuta]|uniref:etoposide-induced protein 2.4 homolog n=1 Tax=Physella acuta TaxID=109671 RepID=UPI0027DD50DC|nr:etoposide-induced protein 2.4 homolog [Physella acuta]XP_059154270.1 etoposide-induced protein 2.4 homolog [Physella acuta]